MPGFTIPGSRHFAIASALAVLASLCGLLEAQNQPNDQTPIGTQNQTPFKLQVKSNLVVVRVVVRDAHGNPVDGLRKEYFKLFEQGKEQSFAQFEVETSAAPPSSALAVSSQGKVASVQSA